MTADRLFSECHKLQNRRFYVPGHPLVQYIKDVFGEIDTHTHTHTFVCLLPAWLKALD